MSEDPLLDRNGEDDPALDAREPTSKGGTAVERDACTVFVRNLPYDFTDEKLEQLFEDAGPIKRGFVVTDKSGASRGFGFVRFSLAADAERAAAEFDKKEVSGRKIQVDRAQRGKVVAKEPKLSKTSSATKKPKPEVLTSASAVAAPVPKPRKKVVSETTKDSCLVLVTGLKQGTSSKSVEKALRKVGKVSSIVMPAPESTPTAVAARIVFAKASDAIKAVKKLQGVQLEGAPVELKQIAEKAARIIVRNLPFNVTEKALHRHFHACGSIASINLPQKNGQAAGFGFVQFDSLAAAQKAIDSLNGSQMGRRPIAVDWALSKGQFSQAVQRQDAAASADAAKAGDREPAAQLSTTTIERDREGEAPDANSGAAAPLNASRQAGKRKAETVNGINSKRPKSADSVDSNDDGRGNEEVADVRDEDADSLVHSDASESEQQTGVEGDEEDDDDDDDDDDSGGDDSGGDDELKAVDSVPDIDVPASTIQRSDVQLGTTVFIRNLSYETTEEQLYAKFAEFGKVKFAKVVKDKDTGHSRGTAFVQFHERSPVDTIMALSPEMSDMTKKERKKLNDSSTVSDALGAGILLGGRVLNITMAVDRNQAQVFAQQHERKKEDRRNLWLAKEGVILPDTEASEGLSKTDLEKRSKAWSEKREKLKNPNYIVSTTRLSVRNLPLLYSEDQLKKLFLDAASKQTVLPGRAKLKQVKILRDKERLDGQGNLRSKRYGFVEFTQHEHALAALRAINNNPSVFSKDSRPIVEFALDDVRKLLVHKRKVEKAQRYQRGRTSSATSHSDEQSKSGTGHEPPCFNCKVRGHRAKDCPNPRVRRKKADFVKGSDDSKDTVTVMPGKRKAGESASAAELSLGRRESVKRIKVARAEPTKEDGVDHPKSRREHKLAEPPSERVAKRQKKEDRGEAKLQGLVDQYKARLFGSQDKDRRSAARWFE